MFLKAHFTNFINLDVSRVTYFPEFPNTSPSGKRVDSNDPIPRKSQNFSKKRHARNVGGDTRPPETSQRSNRGVFVELPPLARINRGLSLLKFFTVFSPSRFLPNSSFYFRREAPCDQVFTGSRLLRTFYGIAFFVTQLLFLPFIVLTFFCFANFVREHRLVIFYECCLYLT
jgi:hypothetical protein